MAQLVVHLNLNWSVLSSKTIKGSHCLLKQETLPSLLSTKLVPGIDFIKLK